MVGNATEEGLLGQIGNPSHSDRGRIIVPAACLAGFLAGYALWRLVPVVTIWAALGLGVLVCAVVGWRLALWFERRDWARWCAEREARRAAETASTERAVAEMRARRRA